MDIKIGDIIVYKVKFRTEALEGIVTDFADVNGSIYYRVVSNLYDHWIHMSQVIEHKLFHSAFLADESNTVIRHLDDLYK